MNSFVCVTMHAIIPELYTTEPEFSICVQCLGHRFQWEKSGDAVVVSTPTLRPCKISSTEPTVTPIPMGELVIFHGAQFCQLMVEVGKDTLL